MNSSTPYSVKLSVGGPTPPKRPRDTEADRQTLRGIQAAARGGDMAGAIALASAAVAGGLDHPLSLNLAAVGLENEGRLEDARTLLLRALDLAPGDLGVLNALGLVALRLERFAEALARFDETLAANAAFPPAHANRGSALLGLGRLAEAEAACRRALELQPGHLAALSGLAAIASRRGDHRAARTYAQQVLAGEPNHPDSTLSLAAADLAEGAAPVAEIRLRGLLADPRPSPFERAMAEGLLADTLDAQDRVQEAFAAYTASNEGLRRLYAPRFGDGESALDVARWLGAWLANAAPFPDPPTAGTESGERTHVFLLGFPRSGTTLLENVLAGHPAVEALEEQETLYDSARAFLDAPAGLDRLAAADEAALASWREAYWRRVRAAGAALDRPVFVDKHPLNTLKLPLIARLFPHAKVLVSRRDPRDVVLSCFRRRFQMSPHMYALLTLEGAANLYAATMEAALRLDRIAVLDHRVVRHERLVAAFEPEVREICAFLGLEWTPAMGDVAARVAGRSIATPSGAQLARGLNAEGVGQWRRYRVAMAPVLPVLQPWVDLFGYDLD